MGLLSSSSASSETDIQETTVNAVDYRQLEDNGNGYVEGNDTFTTVGRRTYGTSLTEKGARSITLGASNRHNAIVTTEEGSSATALNNVRVGGRGTLNVETTDHGAIDAGRQIASEALAGNQSALDNALDFAGESAADARQLVSDTIELAAERTASQAENLLGDFTKLAGVIGAGVVLALVGSAWAKARA